MQGGGASPGLLLARGGTVARAAVGALLCCAMPPAPPLRGFAAAVQFGGRSGDRGRKLRSVVRVKLP